MNENKRKRINLFVRLTRKEAKDKILQSQKMLGRKLNREEKKKIIDEVAGKAKRRVAIIGLSAMLGIGGGTLLLASGDREIHEDTTKISTELDSSKEFRNELKVEEQIENNQIEEEIDELNTKEEVLNYIKNIYVKEYNSQNNEQITADNITLHRYRSDIVLYDDISLNGEQIVRKCTENEAKELGKSIMPNNGIITVSIKTGNETKGERVAYYNGKYNTVYNKDEKVLKEEKTVLSKVAKIITAGISRAESIEQEDTSYSQKQEYKKRLIDAVTEYENNKNVSQKTHETGEMEL